VDDPVEVGKRCRVRQCPGSKRCPVKAPITEDHLSPESGGDLLEDRLARCLGLANELIGVYKGRSPLLKQPSNGGFPSSDVARQRD